MQEGIKLFKTSKHEAHDRYLHLLKDQSEYVQKGADECLKKNSLSLAYQAKSSYIYIFGHARTHDDGFTKRLIWQPRLSKPTPEPNSYLFRAESNTDVMEVCWVLPPSEFWGQFKEGNVVDSDIVEWSIHMYKTRREDLAKPFPEDLSDPRAKEILLSIAREMEESKRASSAVLTASSWA
jgi:hypothetical protein